MQTLTPLAPNNQALPQRPKLGLRKPVTVPVADTKFWFCWVTGRRGPRHRYGRAAEAFAEAKRLRQLLGPEFVVNVYEAVEITEETL